MGKKRKVKTLLLLIVDIIIITFSYCLSYIFRYGMQAFGREALDEFLKNYVVIVGVYLIFLAIFKMYNSILRGAGIYEAVNGVAACICAGAVNFIYMEFFVSRVPRLVTLLAFLFITVGVVGVRLSLRILTRIMFIPENFNKENKENILIIGAGLQAQILITEIQQDKDNNYNIIGLIDDDANKSGIYLKGYKVLGNRNNIQQIVKEHSIKVIFIAITSINKKNLSQIIEICKDSKVKVKIIPGVKELIHGESNLKQMRDVDLRDLLGREEINLDKKGISEYIENKVVLVTGAGGSIGSELVRQIINFKPRKLVLIDIYENNIYELQTELGRKYPMLDIDVLIASVRDTKRIDAIFKQYKPQVIFHAAAHKHVPLMEVSPIEAIKNNSLGTLKLAEAADRYNCERFVLISTDKAVNPTNVMGATKRLCEMIVQAIDRESKTEFVAVRFGNVLGSNGSVIPLFQKQIQEGGPVTLTHKEITRYFMLIPEAAQLVLQAGAFAKGGEIFVLDMGSPVKIYDLAENLIKLSGYEPHKDIQIKITGLRPGEKLYEELLMNEEGLEKTTHEKIFIGVPREYELKHIKNQLKDLIEIGTLEEKDILINKLREVVPTFVDPNVINEVAVSKF